MRSYINSLALGSALAVMALHAAPAPKAGAKAPPPPPPSPSPASKYALDSGFEIPAARVGAKRGDGETYPFADMLIGQSFLLPVTVPATVTDPAEVSKTFKEEARKLSNRVSGAIRRFRKTAPNGNFAIRTVNDDKLGHGVRVWREADTATT